MRGTTSITQQITARFVLTRHTKDGFVRDVFVPSDSGLLPAFRLEATVGKRSDFYDMSVLIDLTTGRRCGTWDRRLLEDSAGLCRRWVPTLTLRVESALYGGRVLLIKTPEGTASVGRRCVAVDDDGDEFEIYGGGMDRTGNASDIAKVLTETPHRRAVVSAELRRIGV